MDQPAYEAEPLLTPEVFSAAGDDVAEEYASSVDAQEETSGLTWKDHLFAVIFPYVFWFVYSLGFLLTVPSRLYNKYKLQIESFVLYSRVTPAMIRKDVSSLNKVPRHVAAILTLQPVNLAGGGIEGLLHDVSELATWCIGAGPSELTLYERTGALKNMPLNEVNRAVKGALERYFGQKDCPTAYLYVPSTKSSVGDASTATLRVNLLSYEDGRPLFVKLTQQLAKDVSEHKLEVDDIDVNFLEDKLIDRVGSEPDLLLMFTPTIDFQGFPPWHLRLSEIAHLPGNTATSYMVFIRALKKFANVKINLGK